MANNFKAYKEQSRANWGADFKEGEQLSRDQIQLGAILRIADSLEKMEKPYAQLLDSVNYLRNSNKELQYDNSVLKKQVAAFKGIINKMKKERSGRND